MNSVVGMHVDVAAVVVTYNSEGDVGGLLDSLPAAFGDLSWSVVVVDNGSTDGTVALLEARRDCVVVRSTNEGFAAGVNRGVAASPRSTAVLVLNPDTTLDPGAVQRMCQVLDRPQVGVVAPRVREVDGRLSPTLRRRPTLARVGGLSFTRLPLFTERIENPGEYQLEHQVDWAVGAILLVDRECYDALDGFDESFFLYSEETDFSLRARDAGWATVYAPDAGGMHVGGASGESADTHTMKMVNRLRLYRRRTGTGRATAYFALLVVVELRRAVLGHAYSRTTLRALLRPALRPAVLGASDGWLPR